MTQCADQAGYAVEEIGNCLQDERFVETLWEEKMEDLKTKRWYSVSPYILLNGERVSRIEEIPERICVITTKYFFVLNISRKGLHNGFNVHGNHIRPQRFVFQKAVQAVGQRPVCVDFDRQMQAFGFPDQRFQKR